MTPRTTRLAWLGLALATIIAYLPALSAPFLFDDQLIDKAGEIHQLWPASVPLHPSGRSTPMAGRPIANYTLAINYAINDVLGVDQRPDPDGPHKGVGYRLFNLLLHLACGALLFGILRRTLQCQSFSEWWRDPSRADGASFLVTSIWLLHPLQSEAVIYIVQRTEIIVSGCYLATLYASIRAWDAATPRSRRWWYVTGVAACLLGMGSKEVMISAPLAVMLYDVAFHRTTPGKQRIHDGRRSYYVALWATAGWLIFLMRAGPRSNTVGFDLGLPWYRYLYSQAWAILHYLRLFLWPNRLTLDYGVEPVRGPAGVPGAFVLGGLLIATCVAWARPRRWGWFAFLGAWFFLLLGPSSSVVPIVTEIAAERRIYLALASVIVLVVLAVVAVSRRALRHRRAAFPSHAFAGATFVLCPLLVGATFERSRIYRNPVGMWRDVVNKTPLNDRGYIDLAEQLLAQTPPGDAEAEDVLRRSLQVDSEYAPSPVNRGIIMTDLGIVYMDLGQLDSAASSLRIAVQLDSGSEVALNRLGAVLLGLGQPNEAVPYLEAAVQRQPGSGLSLALLSRAYAESGHLDDAAGAAAYASQRTGASPEALTALGDAEAAMGKRDDAAALYQRALAAQSGYPPAAQRLARLRHPG